MLARLSWHESHAKDASIGGITETVNSDRLAALASEFAFHDNVCKRIGSVRVVYIEPDLDEVIGIHCFRRLGEFHCRRRGEERCWLGSDSEQ